MLGSRLIKAYRYSYLRYLYWLSFGEDILSIRVPINVWIFFGKAIHQALLNSGQIETKESAPRVVKDSKQAIYNAIYLKGATMREKEIFAQTLTEFFAPIENQRYILKSCHKVKGSNRIFAVPSMFEKRKADAESFLRHIQKRRKI